MARDIAVRLMVDAWGYGRCQICMQQQNDDVCTAGAFSLGALPISVKHAAIMNDGGLIDARLAESQ